MRGTLSQWLMHEDQKDLFEVLVALALNVLFLGLAVLLLWPLGRLRLVLELVRGYGILWIVTCGTVLLLRRIHDFFRVNIYDHANAFVISNLAVSCFLQVGWAAFAALTVHRFVTGVPVWTLVLLYCIGALSCLAAFFAVSAFFQGHVYKLISLPLALVGFLVFSVWPASGRAIYGWFFRLF
jgi:hypothetical protein